VPLCHSSDTSKSSFKDKESAFDQALAKDGLGDSLEAILSSKELPYSEKEDRVEILLKTDFGSLSKELTKVFMETFSRLLLLSKKPSEVEPDISSSFVAKFVNTSRISRELILKGIFEGSDPVLNRDFTPKSGAYATTYTSAHNYSSLVNNPDMHRSFLIKLHNCSNRLKGHLEGANLVSEAEIEILLASLLDLNMEYTSTPEEVGEVYDRVVGLKDADLRVFTLRLLRADRLLGEFSRRLLPEKKLNELILDKPYSIDKWDKFEGGPPCL